MTRSLCTLEREMHGGERESRCCNAASSRLTKGTNPKATSIPAKMHRNTALLSHVLEQEAQAADCSSIPRQNSKLLKKNQTGGTKHASVETKPCNKSYKKHRCKKRPAFHKPNPQREASPMHVHIYKSRLMQAASTL